MRNPLRGVAEAPPDSGATIYYGCLAFVLVVLSVSIAAALWWWLS